jgi:hypothetical protein
VIFPTIEGLGGTGGAASGQWRRAVGGTEEEAAIDGSHRRSRSTRTETYPVSYYVLLLMSGIVPLLIYYALQVT